MQGGQFYFDEGGHFYSGVNTVVAALMAALEENRFLVSLTPGTRDKMVAYASDPEPSKHVRQRS